MSSELLSIKSKQHKCVHFVGLLRLDQLFEVLDLKLIQPEEGKVGEDRIHGHIVAVKGVMQLIKHLIENLEELFVTYAPIKYLLNENFLVRVFQLKESFDWWQWVNLLF